ncbi:hypothetical protein SAMN04490190_1793 [Pseudomonas libanensis]|uniref:Uncharacterized protein n=1 Tax=Pseudomonas synxantha TaxID=47883 RepID=A0AAX3I9W3_9PSED|nr:hypothetical protein C4K01_2273 [Pseudomonas synxantha]MDQ0980457.1 hypothetical protein [Pseudomonas synxantha]SDK82163.1 hypothetical protein SAMN04490190_1793 [Pseudomonas libanensis]SDU39699.1 hypothetical protein SAMN05216475_2926 [Pseudomonas synxantha]VTR01128.1 Uncharacterised protein [Pseudomonas synxantha]
MRVLRDYDHRTPSLRVWDIGFLKHLADGVDGDVRPAYSADGVGKQLLDGTRCGQISLQRDGLRTAMALSGLLD